MFIVNTANGTSNRQGSHICYHAHCVFILTVYIVCQRVLFSICLLFLDIEITQGVCVSES